MNELYDLIDELIQKKEDDYDSLQNSRLSCKEAIQSEILIEIRDLEKAREILKKYFR